MNLKFGSQLFFFFFSFSKASQQLGTIQIVQPESHALGSISVDTVTEKETVTPGEYTVDGSIIVKGEDGKLFDGNIHKKMVVWLVNQNCAANFSMYQLFAPMFGVEIETSFGSDTDTTNGVPVKLVQKAVEAMIDDTTDQQSKKRGEVTQTVETNVQPPNKLTETKQTVETKEQPSNELAGAIVETKDQPSNKLGGDRFKYTTRTSTRGASNALKK